MQGLFTETQLTKCNSIYENKIDTNKINLDEIKIDETNLDQISSYKLDKLDIEFTCPNCKHNYPNIFEYIRYESQCNTSNSDTTSLDTSLLDAIVFGLDNNESKDNKCNKYDKIQTDSNIFNFEQYELYFCENCCKFCLK